jgi:amino acid adenylation domain-containing protein/non-ribosomal peptide synthase protein (TIGR01720 family)
MDTTTESRIDVLVPDEAEATATLWTAWALLLSVSANSEDTVFGAAVSPPTPSLPGSSRNSQSLVPIRTIIDQDLPATQAIQNALAIFNETQQFRGIDQHWVRLLGEDGERACSFRTLLQVERALLKTDVDQTEPWTPCEDIAVFLRCQVLDGSIRLLCRFDSSVIQPARIQLTLRQFGHLIRQLSHRDPKATIQDIQAVSEEDLTAIWTWNADLPQDVEACVHHQFIGIATKQPAAPAVCAWDGDFTYEELDTLSTRVASHLLTLDARPGTGSIIPLCFEKSKWTVVGMLAIMKAGAASVAMDPSYPEAHLQSIVQQAHAHGSKQHFILSSKMNEDLSKRLAQDSAATTVVVETLALDQSTAVIDWDNISVKPSDLLYVVFTSGSTGTPKGAMISHRNFSSAIEHQKVQLDTSSRVFDFASYAFDAAWFNALRPLVAGGCVCIPSEHERKNDLTQSIRKTGANYVVMTPTAARLMKPEEVPSLRRIIFAGEKLRSSDISKWKGLVDVGNCYGAAECTIGNTLTMDSSGESGDPSMGRGCGTITWIARLDGRSLAAIGEVGELWLEGPLVGQGYLGDPKKTADAFVRDPHWLLQGAPGISGRHGRLYRTGDLARYNPDGSLQFIERKDSQVKIRGQRVELEHVEAHVKAMLSNTPDAQVVAEVIAPRDSPNPVLVVFTSPPSAPDVGHEKLKRIVAGLTRGLNEKLLARLPAHMIPSTYVPMASIPTTVTGKTDRRQLRQIGSGLDLLQFVEADVSDPPSSEIELILARSWADVLNVPFERISIGTPFTKLGGDSITAMQLISRLRAQKVQVAVSDILRHSTIEAIAPKCRLLTQATVDKDDTEAIDEVWGLSPVQRLFFSLHPDGLDHFNQSFLLELTETFNRDEVQRACTSLVLRHAMLRARFKRGSDGWEQFIVRNGPDAFLFSAHSVSHAEMNALAQTRQESLDIMNGPVFAVDYFHVGDNQVFILLTGHHLVIDLVSWRILWRDLEELLRGTPALPPFTGTSFRKWAALQERIGKEKVPSEHLPFQLTHDVESWGVSPSENTLSAVKDYDVQLDTQTTSLLLGGANRGLKTEPLDIMVGVLIYSLYKAFPDRPALAIFLEGHGREPIGNDSSVDLSETIGWFTSLCPVQVSLQRRDTIVDTIRLVKDTRRAIPDKGLPYFAALNHHQGGASGNDQQNVEFIFNYGGVFQQLEGGKSIFRRTDLELTQASPNTRRLAFVEVNGSIIEGALRLSISIHQRAHHHQTLVDWSHRLPDEFRSATLSLDSMSPTPTLSDFPLLGLSYDKLDSIMAHLLRKGIRSEDVLDLMPCTTLQEGILLGIARGSASYHIVQVWECSTVRGEPVDAKRLEAAWKTATSHHSILSNTFIESAELLSFLQVQLPHNTAQIRRLVSSGAEPATDTLAQMEPPIFSDVESPFRVTISESSSDTGLKTVACRLDISHALIDAMSLPILLGDVSNAYDQGRSTPVPGFHAVMEEIMRVPPETKWEYWMQFLDGVRPCRIPTISHDTGTDEDGHHEQATIDKSVTDRISAFCQDKDITRATFLQVSWAMALSQLTRKQDVCFGYLASGRDINLEGVDNMVGPLINTLVNRIDAGSPVGTVLEDTGRHLISHFEFQHISLAQLQSGLQLHGEQLFNTSMTVRKAVRDEEASTASLRMKSVSGSNTNEVCELEFHMRQSILRTS